MEKAMLQARESLVLKRVYPVAPEKDWRADVKRHGQLLQEFRGT